MVSPKREFATVLGMSGGPYILKAAFVILVALWAGNVVSEETSGENLADVRGLDAAPGAITVVVVMYALTNV